MIEETRTIYRCQYCERSRKHIWLTRAAAERHEKHCPNNIDRKPYIGELYDEYENFFSGLDFGFLASKPDEYGMIWDGKEWQPVPEFQPHFYDNNPFRDDNQWPEFDFGYEDKHSWKHLNEVNQWAYRLELLLDQYGATWAQDERARRDEAAKPKMLTCEVNL